MAPLRQPFEQQSLIFNWAIERHYPFLNHLPDLFTSTDTWFYCTEAKTNKSTNNSWCLIIQVTQVINCWGTYRKTLACWAFGHDKRAVTVSVHALAFHRNGDKDLNPGHPGLGQSKGPWQGFVPGMNECPSPSKWSNTEIAVLHQDACRGVRLSVPSHATLELLNLPGEQDLWFMNHELKGRQHNPLIWYRYSASWVAY